MDSVKFFSIKRLKSYKNEQEHKKNFFASTGISSKTWYFRNNYEKFSF
ncbi:hypothetical protein [Campylobacter concisus]